MQWVPSAGGESSGSATTTAATSEPHASGSNSSTTRRLTPVRLVDERVELLQAMLQLCRVTAFHLLLVEFNLSVEDRFAGLFHRFGCGHCCCCCSDCGLVLNLAPGSRRRRLFGCGRRRWWLLLEVPFQLFDRLLESAHRLHHSRPFLRLHRALVLLQSLNENALLLQLLVQQLLLAPLQIHLQFGRLALLFFLFLLERLFGSENLLTALYGSHRLLALFLFGLGRLFHCRFIQDGGAWWSAAHLRLTQHSLPSSNYSTQSIFDAERFRCGTGRWLVLALLLLLLVVPKHFDESVVEHRFGATVGRLCLRVRRESHQSAFRVATKRNLEVDDLAKLAEVIV